MASDGPTDADHVIHIAINSGTSEMKDGWMIAMNAILELMYQRNISGIGVEIINPHALQRFFAPVVDESFKTAWPSLEAQIIGVLGLGAKEWESLTVYNRGHDEKNASPTVIIGVTRAANVEWQTTVYEILHGLLEPYPGVEVGFVRSSFDLDAQGQYVALDAFTSPVDLGSGIGNVNNSGTLG